MTDAKFRILVVDDDPTMRDILEIRLQRWGYRVLLAADACEASEILHREDPDLILSDVVMPEISGIDLLRELKRTDVDRPVVLMTAHGTMEMGVEAMKVGAMDFLSKPLDYDRLRAVLADGVRRSRELLLARRIGGGRGGALGRFVGTSPQMLRVYELIAALARSDAAVLITGESGTGKELAARTIHEQGRRAEGPFTALNTAAIPGELVESEVFGHEKGAFTGAGQDRVGCFEMADGGTLFLDEIAEMPVALQPKLLRVLDEGRFRRVGGRREITTDVRILSATNRAPRSAVHEGRLREDLYYRLNVFTLHLPPLRQREGDVPRLAQHFLDHFRRQYGGPVRALRESTIEALEGYPWPGNVRELRNVMERSVILSPGEWIEPDILPAWLRYPEVETGPVLSLPSGISIAEMEKRLILQTLDETGNNKAETARRLGVHERTIRNKVRAYGLTR